MPHITRHLPMFCSSQIKAQDSHDGCSPHHTETLLQLDGERGKQRPFWMYFCKYILKTKSKLQNHCKSFYKLWACGLFNVLNKLKQCKDIGRSVVTLCRREPGPVFSFCEQFSECCPRVPVTGPRAGAAGRSPTTNEFFSPMFPTLSG